MYTMPEPVEFHATVAHAAVNVEFGVASGGARTALAVEIPLMVLALATVVLRLYSRLAIKRKLAADDILIILGASAAFARTVISCMSADDDWGYDRKGPDRSSEVPYYQHIFERRIAYLLAVTFVRFSVLAYYLRIFPSGMTSLRRLCYVLIVCALAFFIEVFTVLIYYCQDIGKLWTKDWLDFHGSQCFSSAAYSYSAAIGDSIIDSMIFALPVPYVVRLSKLRIRQRLGLVIIFGMGFAVCVVALLQIPFIRKREGSTTYFGTSVNILIAIQIFFAIIAASLPDLRALIARTVPSFSPLHHRSLVTAAAQGNGNRGQAEILDVEQGSPNMGMTERPRAAFDRKRSSWKPDWLRSDIPASLMSTRVTQNEITRLSQGSSQLQIPSTPQIPTKAAG